MAEFSHFFAAVITVLDDRIKPLRAFAKFLIPLHLGISAPIKWIGISGIIVAISYPNRLYYQALAAPES